MHTATSPSSAGLSLPSASSSEEEGSQSCGVQTTMPLELARAEAAQRREESMALLREAAVRLRPENWLSASAEKPSDSGFEDVRSRYHHWLEHAPFNSADPVTWRFLVDLAISYASYTYRPARGLRRAEADALVSWFTCFWKLDNLVDDARELLPPNYLEALRQDMKRAWFGSEEQLDALLPQHEGDVVAFRDQAVALLIDHRKQLRTLGQPIENHPGYQNAVWNHIICQTEAPRRVDSLPEYLEMRRIRGGMECVLHMYLTLQGLDWDESYARVLDLANLATCLTDDLFSVVKDQRDGVESSVTVCGPNGHLRVLELVCDLHREMFELLKRRVAADGSVQTQLFVRTMLDVVVGMVQWQAANPRYREGALWLDQELRAQRGEAARAA
ncbi:hypothetical protein D187_008105 [Cystobacter fuscus DSM 2262]|uniref:Terpene synthase n=1 Tax=Cystobacter fuscus (strain ATCC 25194 / DSM 2262 / NBRC 100088 / M29) TaxID=1242864 RepID=S9NUH5_CYSF2|nr:terpene synthase family protein [Cystobacter fuscus]EPX55850.1 hypothetical protein D187_008105 [Cystobacter fuscus DSM 2262]